MAVGLVAWRETVCLDCVFQTDGKLKKSTSVPDLTARDHDQLQRGRAEPELQDVYTRAKTLQVCARP